MINNCCTCLLKAQAELFSAKGLSCFMKRFKLPKNKSAFLIKNYSCPKNEGVSNTLMNKL